jgi:hypothetical protein
LDVNGPPPPMIGLPLASVPEVKVTLGPAEAGPAEAAGLMRRETDEVRVRRWCGTFGRMSIVGGRLGEVVGDAQSGEKVRRAEQEPCLRRVGRAVGEFVVKSSSRRSERGTAGRGLRRRPLQIRAASEAARPTLPEISLHPSHFHLASAFKSELQLTQVGRDGHIRSAAVLHQMACPAVEGRTNSSSPLPSSLSSSSSESSSDSSSDSSSLPDSSLVNRKETRRSSQHPTS